MKELSKSKKAVYIVISILVAVIFWLYVDNTNANERNIYLDNIPVTFVGENEELAERGLMITSGGDVKIDLRLQGRRQVIYKLNKSNVKIQADVSGITGVGQHTLNYTVIYPNNISPNSVSVMSASIYSIPIEVGELHSKTVAVVADIKGDVPDGYMLHECTISPETITVSGSLEEVKQVDHALVEVALNNAVSSYSEYKNYQLIDTKGKVIGHSDLRVSADKVRVEIPVVTLKEVPLEVEFIESGGSAATDIQYEITPPRVTISGEQNVLDKIDSISVAEIHLNQILSDDILEYEIPMPGGCQNESGTEKAKISIKFNDMQTQTFECTNIFFSNRPEGYEATAITQSLDVTLRGKQEDLALIKPQNIRIVVDLSGMSSASGTYTAKAKAYVDGTSCVGAIGTYQVGYRLRKI